MLQNETESLFIICLVIHIHTWTRRPLYPRNNSVHSLYVQLVERNQQQRDIKWSKMITWYFRNEDVRVYIFRLCSSSGDVYLCALLTAML